VEQQGLGQCHHPREEALRYGPRYTKAMLSVAFLTLFLPIPGSLLVGLALIVVIAEATGWSS
jgi:hypothetical protein